MIEVTGFEDEPWTLILTLTLTLNPNLELTVTLTLILTVTGTKFLKENKGQNTTPKKRSTKSYISRLMLLGRGGGKEGHVSPAQSDNSFFEVRQVE